MKEVQIPDSIERGYQLYKVDHATSILILNDSSEGYKHCKQMSSQLAEQDKTGHRSCSNTDSKGNNDEIKNSDWNKL